MALAHGHDLVPAGGGNDAEEMHRRLANKRRCAVRAEARASLEAIVDSCTGTRSCKRSFQILLGMLFSHDRMDLFNEDRTGPEASSFLIGRICALLSGNLETPLYLRRRLQFYFGPWRIMTEANLTAKRAANKVARALGRKDDDTLLKKIVVDWKTGLAAIKAQYRQHSATMASLGRKDGKMLLVMTFRSWDDVVKKIRAEESSKYEAERAKQEHDAMVQRNLKKMLMNMGSALLALSFDGWGQTAREVKQKIAMALQMIGMSGKKKGLEEVRCIFHEWKEIRAKEKHKSDGVKRLLVTLAESTSVLVQTCIREWASFVEEEREAKQNSAKVLGMFSGKRAARDSQSFFQAWRNLVRTIIQEKKTAEMKKVREQAKQRSVMQKLTGSDSMLISSTFADWCMGLAERKYEAETAEKKRAAVLKTLRLAMDNKAGVLLAVALRGWRDVQVEERRLKKDEEKNAAFAQMQFAAKQQGSGATAQVIQMMSAQGDAYLKKTCFEGWKEVVAYEREKTAKVDAGKKMMHIMSNKDGNRLLQTVLPLWSNLVKDDLGRKRENEKIARRRMFETDEKCLHRNFQDWIAFYEEALAKKGKEEAQKKAMLLMSGNNARTVWTLVFEAWEAYTAKVKQKLKLQVKMLTVSIGNAMKETLHIVYRAWREDTRAVLGERDAAAARDQAVKALVRRWQGPQLDFYFPAWVQVLVNVRKQREADKKEQAVSSLFAKNDDKAELARVWKYWKRFVDEGRLDREIKKAMEDKQAVGAQNHWAGGKLMAAAHTTLLLGVFCHFARICSKKKQTEATALLKKAQIHRSMLQGEFTRMKLRLDERNCVQVVLTWWMRVFSWPLGRVVRRLKHAGARLHVLDTGARTATLFNAWWRVVRSRRRQRWMVRGGVARWIAAGNVMLVSFAYREWHSQANGATSERRAESGRQSGLEVETLRARSAKARAQIQRSQKAAELGAKLMAREQNRHVLAEVIQCWWMKAVTRPENSRGEGLLSLGLGAIDNTRVAILQRRERPEPQV